MSAIEELELRAGASDEDREAWLAERAMGVTATEVKELAMGGPGAPWAVLDRKVNPHNFDTKQMAWGRKREAERLAPWAEDEFGFRWEHRVFHSALNRQYLASPDAIMVNLDGELVLAEFKTSKFNLSSVNELRKLGYTDQVQWQMFVTGAVSTLIIGEQHDDHWIDRGGEWPEPTPLTLEPSVVEVPRDDGRIDFLRRKADEFLEFMVNPDRTGPAAYEALVDRVRRARVSEASAHEITAAAEKALRAALDEGHVEHLETDRWRLSYSAGKPRESFDSKALKKAHPDIYKLFIKMGATPKPRLTLTEKEKS
jgi:hypothetical protein